MFYTLFGNMGHPIMLHETHCLNLLFLPVLFIISKCYALAQWNLLCMLAYETRIIPVPVTSNLWDQNYLSPCPILLLEAK